MEFYNLEPDKAFLVSAKAAIVRDGKILLLHSTTEHKNWEPPGGIVEMEESFIDGLRREVKEETTLEILVEDPIWASDDWRKNFRFRDGAVRDVRVVEIIYRCGAVSNSIVLGEEHNEYAWVGPEEMDVLAMFPYQREPLKKLFGISASRIGS